MKIRTLITVALLASMAAFVHLYTVGETNVQRPLSEIPVLVKDWKLVREHKFSVNVVRTLNPTEYIVRIYQNALGDVVELYVGFYNGSHKFGSIHSPKNCLPGNGWYRESFDDRTMNVEGDTIPVVEAVYSQEDSHRMFMYYFQVAGTKVTGEYELKIFEIIGSLLRQRRDSAFVRVATAVGQSPEKAQAAIRQFMADFYPVVSAHLPS